MKVGSYALFPDSVTSRGRKHLETLIEVKKSGIRAVMLYVIQRMDIDAFGVAEDIDPQYAKSLRKAIAHGVEVIAVQAKVDKNSITIVKELSVELDNSHTHTGL
jgi:sugar fermentation stimulation protein A